MDKLHGTLWLYLLFDIAFGYSCVCVCVCVCVCECVLEWVSVCYLFFYFH
jgi:hypothetical protein